MGKGDKGAKIFKTKSADAQIPPPSATAVRAVFCTH